jgi:hypothetical protein
MLSVTNTKVRPGPTGIVFESDDSIAQVRPGRSIVNLLLLQHSRVPPRSRRRPQQRANAAGCGEKLARYVDRGTRVTTQHPGTFGSAH